MRTYFVGGQNYGSCSASKSDHKGLTMRCSGSSSNVWRTRARTHGWCIIRRDRLVNISFRVGCSTTVCYLENVFTILTLFYDEVVYKVVFSDNVLLLDTLDPKAIIDSIHSVSTKVLSPDQ